MKAIKIQWYLIKPDILPVFYLIILSAIITLTNNSMILSSLISATLMAVKLVPLPFEVDSDEKLDIFYNVIPISHSDFIKSRYVFLSSFGVIGILITIVLKIIILGLWKNIFFNPNEIIVSMITGLFFYMLVISLQLPLYYKYGKLKARIISMIPILIFVSIFAIYSYTTILNWLLKLISIFNDNLKLILVFMFLFSIFIEYISFNLSKSIIIRKGDK